MIFCTIIHTHSIKYLILMCEAPAAKLFTVKQPRTVLDSEGSCKATRPAEDRLPSFNQNLLTIPMFSSLSLSRNTYITASCALSLTFCHLFVKVPFTDPQTLEINRNLIDRRSPYT
jgi:hypothetical protein